MRKYLQLWTEQVFHGPGIRDANYFQFTGSNVYMYSLETYPLLEDIVVRELLGQCRSWILVCEGWSTPCS